MDTEQRNMRIKSTMIVVLQIQESKTLLNLKNSSLTKYITKHEQKHQKVLFTTKWNVYILASFEKVRI